MINLPDPPDDTEADSVILLGVGGTALALILCCGGVFGGLQASECTAQDANTLLWLVAVCPSLTFLLVVGGSVGVITQQPRKRLAVGLGAGTLITLAAWAAWLPLAARYC
jgi:hypothetical protein